jgi:hypothetical protein
MKTYWGRSGISPIFLFSSLHGGEWLPSRHGRFTPGKHVKKAKRDLTNIHLHLKLMLSPTLEITHKKLYIHSLLITRIQLYFSIDAWLLCLTLYMYCKRAFLFLDIRKGFESKNILEQPFFLMDLSPRIIGENPMESLQP